MGDLGLAPHIPLQQPHISPTYTGAFSRDTYANLSGSHHDRAPTVNMTPSNTLFHTARLFLSSFRFRPSHL
jgi:hypothetical protein